MPYTNTSLRYITWLIFWLTVVLVVWQSPGLYTAQGLAYYLPLHL